MAGGSSSSLVDSLFQRSLDDLIKSLRSHPPSGEPALLSRALDEIRREIRSADQDTKSVALTKLTYLSSLHHLDASWAAFHALELLPSSSLPLKRAAYLAASLSFHPSTTPVLPLATHQLRKDLSSPSSPVVPSLALRLLSSAASPDLVLHLTPDLHALLSSTRPYLRRQAVAVALPVISLSPDSVTVALPRLVDALSDPHAVSAAVGVFCELSASDPQPYLPLAPEFYRILVDSRNNWVLIKVLKIFARLAPLEPRLARRIVDPVCDHMRRSAAKSLLFECIRTVFSCLADHDGAVQLAVEKVREFLAFDDDPNLRFLGLHALSMLGPRHSWAVEENREVVIRSLTDPDPNIRREALDLVMGMVLENNTIEISELLVKHALRSDPEFCNEILDAVLSTCERNVYELIVDFDWYVSLLGDMARNPHCTKGVEIERQLVDIGLRVRDARQELVRVARDLLIDPALLGNPFLYRILSAAAWVSGEYVEFSRNPVELVEALLQPRTNLLPSMVRAVYIQAMFKVLTFYFTSNIDQMETGQFSPLGDSNSGKANCETDENTPPESGDGVVNSNRPASSLGLLETERFTLESLVYILNLIETALAPLSVCDEVEVQERARNVLGLIHMLRKIQVWDTKEGFKKDGKTGEIVKHMRSVFSVELGPVSANAQQKVTVPDGIVLKENLADLATILTDDDIVPSSSITFSLRSHHYGESKENPTFSVESTSLLANHRRQHVLYYLPTEKGVTDSNDYPRATDSQSLISHVDVTEDLVKLTELPLIPRKAKHTKQRPVVVKLEEGDCPSTSSLKPVKESKNDLLSGAIRDVFLGNEGKPASSQMKSSDKPSRRREKEESVSSESKGNLNLGEKEHGSSSSTRSRRHSHGKQRHKNPHKNEDLEEKSHRNSSRSDHHHERHRHRQRDASLNVVPRAPVIQDFLL